MIRDLSNEAYHARPEISSSDVKAVAAKSLAHWKGKVWKDNAERLEAALREVVTCVEDGCFCSEMKMATAIDEARTALKGADHE